MNFQVMALVMRKKFGSPTKKAVITQMASHINEVKQPYAWPSAIRLGLRCEVAEKTVRRTWEKLAEDGIIKHVSNKSVRGGQIKVWQINLRAITALDDAIPTLETELEEPDELPDILSGGEANHRTLAPTTTGHSLPQPPDTVSDEVSIGNIQKKQKDVCASEDLSGILLEKLWQAIPQVRRGRTSRKKISKQLGMIKQLGDVTGRELLTAWQMFVSSEEGRRENHRYVPGLHVWLKDGKYDAFIEQIRQQASPELPLLSPEDETAERLDQCFEIYARTGSWYGANNGFTLKPEDPQAPYPVELYQKYNLQKNGAAT